MRTSSESKFFRLVAAMLATAGCAPIPPELPPLDEALASIETGVTSRADVLTKLGEPTVSRRGGKFVAYAAEQYAGGAFALGQGISFIRFHLLAVAYDEDGIVSMTSLQSSESRRERGLSRADLCIPSGECFRLLYSSSSINVSRAPFVAVFGNDEEDKAAKDIRSHEMSCTLYHFYEPIDSAWSYNVVLDDRRLGLSANDGFVRYRIDPGRHKLSLLGSDSRSFYFECPPAAIVFVKLYKTGWLDHEFAAVSEKEGRLGVLERRLILLD